MTSLTWKGPQFMIFTLVFYVMIPVSVISAIGFNHIIVPWPIVILHFWLAGFCGYWIRGRLLRSIVIRTWEPARK